MATKPSEINLSCFFGILFTIPHDIYYTSTPILPHSRKNDQSNLTPPLLNQSFKSTDTDENNFDINSLINTNEDSDIIEPNVMVRFTSFLIDNWKQKITNEIKQKTTQYKLQFNN